MSMNSERACQWAAILMGLALVLALPSQAGDQATGETATAQP
jgi:hypothetical protein